MISESTQYIVISSLAKSKAITGLVEVLETTGWPAKSFFLQAVQSGASEYWVHDVAESSDRPTNPKPVSERMVAEASSWVDVVKRLNLTVEDLDVTTLVEYWVTAKMYSPLQHVIANSSVPLLKKWLAEKSACFSFADSGHDRCNKLGQFVKKGAIPVLEALAQKDPQLLHVLDRKDRSALFYVRSQRMAKFLGPLVDNSLTDKDGHTAMEVWVDQIRSPNAPKWIEALGTSDLTQSMVVKLVSLQISGMSEGETQLLERASANPQWSWKGKIYGVEKEWTLPEIWKFGVVLTGTRAIATTIPGVGPHVTYYGDQGGPLVECHLEFDAYVKEKEALLPQPLRTALDSPTRPMTERVLEWMSGFAQTQGETYSGSRSDVWGVTESVYKAHGANSYGRALRDKLSVFFVPLEFMASAFLPQQRKEFGDALAVYAHSELWEKEFLKTKIRMSANSLVLPVEHGGVLTPALSSAIAFLRQEEGLRKSTLGYAWANAWNANGKGVWEQDARTNDVQKWGPVLQLGLSYMAIIDENPLLHKDTTPTSRGLFEMLQNDVEIEKIPMRFAKKLPAELRAAASRWIIQNSLSKPKKLQEKMEEAPKPKRKM